MTLWTQFQDLAPSDDGRPAEPLTGIALIRGGCHYVYKDVGGRPCAMFRLDERDQEPVLAIQLQHLRVEPGLHCRVRTEGQQVEGHYGVVRCLSQNEQLHEYLLKVLENVLEGHTRPIAPKDLNDLILRLVELFEAAEAVPEGTVAGLWAELFVALRSRSPLVLLEAWHAGPGERYDFAKESERLEVKSSTRRRREHHFSFEQAHPPEGLRVIVASMFVEASRGGLSLGELWDEARDSARGNPELITMIERVCMRTLGKGWNGAREARFDDQLAQDSLRFFAVETMPRLASPLPPGVLNAEFIADLCGCPEFPMRQGAGLGLLLTASMERVTS